MTIKPIRSEKDYQTSLLHIEALFENNLETNLHAQDELEILTTLIEAYEAKHYPMPPSNPIDALFFIMDQKGLKRKDMEQYLGSKSRVSEVLNGKINLSMKQVIRLHKSLGIPYESLICEAIA
ncbi:MAG TPA: helix-turn-helix domain-containing protein [Leucothrix mucor]|nr:helix-turn-helix domain-containing protein [Leucothrix mucor]